MARWSSANGAGTARLVLVSLLVSLFQCSHAFVIMRRSGEASGRGALYRSSTSSTSATARSSSGVPVTGTAQAGIGPFHTSTSPTRRDARLERMATLGKVRWHPVQSGHGRTVEAAATAAARVAYSRDRFLGSATSLTGRSGSSGAESWGGGTVQMGARGVGRGVGRGLSSVGRAVVRVLRRGGGKASAAAAGASGSTAAGGRGGAAPPAEGALVDVDDVLRQSELLLKGEDEDGSAGNKRVLILMSDTGGGHRASAQALKAAFDELYPGAVDVDIVDLWTAHAKWPFNKFVSAYQFMAKRPPIWRAFWEYGRFPLTRQITNEMANFQCHKRFRSMLEEYKPDLVVSVHPLCQEVPIRVMKKMGGGVREIPFVTVVTDLGGAHPTWFHREVDACFVPSDRLAALAQNCGLSPQQIRLHGLPIRPGFWGKNDASTVNKKDGGNGQSAKAELQEKLGLKPGVKACLVVGVGDGVGGLQGIADSVGQKLGQETAETQVVVVCGTNDVVKNSLEQGNWASNVHMHVKGFVSNMDEWMGAVDCIVTKAGPGTIAEAMIRGLPIMLSAFLPGQEAGNVPFVTEGGFGSFSRDPAKIADTVSRWLRDDDLLAKMSSKAKEASRPQATYKICSDIGEMLFGTTAGIEAATVGKKGASLSVA